MHTVPFILPDDRYTLHNLLMIRNNDQLNNSVESWHSAFQSSLQCAHPSVWKAIKAIKKENALQSMVLA